MKGDFTRFRFDLKKHYVSVLKQQGRVDLDSDWNENIKIQEYLRETTNRDVIGICGYPEENGGFEIAIDKTNFFSVFFIDEKKGWAVGEDNAAETLDLVEALGQHLRKKA